ncbi:MAG: thiol-disulfide oxidoreductase DCC family protein [Deltaproteobacteria bacterium]
MRPAVLIYDGECPVCVNAVEWIRARALPDAFEFLSCHSETLPSRFPAIGKEACLRAMHLVLPDGTVLAGEQAMPEILRRLRRYRWCASLFRLPGAGILSRVFYRWFAKRRHRAAGFFFPARKGRNREIH